MSDATQPRPPATAAEAATEAVTETGEVRPEDLGHPRGTLAIVVLYGLLFALGWLALYLFKFLGQGAPTS